MDSLPACISNAKISVSISAGKVILGRERCRLRLLGRVFWPLPKPLHALHHDLARQWKIKLREVAIFEAGHRLIRFILTSFATRTTVYESQPWCFKNHIINLIPWETPSQDVFDHLQFMVLSIQLSELPPHCTTVQVGKELLAPVGEVISVALFTLRPNGDGRPFVKVVVKMDLLRSFPGKMEVLVEGEPPFDVYLGYEGLSAICYLCGILGHINRNCSHAGTITPTPSLRGGWMQAKPSGFLLEDLVCPATAIAQPRRNLSEKNRGLSRLGQPLPEDFPSPSLQGQDNTDETPLINGIVSSTILSIELIES
ncbi:hypothetical protein LINGRAHAP2_LOCUS1738 [Linum grandiflorum]